MPSCELVSNKFWGGGGQQLKGQKSIKEIRKKSTQKPIYCERHQAGMRCCSVLRLDTLGHVIRGQRSKK